MKYVSFKKVAEIKRNLIRPSDSELEQILDRKRGDPESFDEMLGRFGERFGERHGRVLDTEE